MKILVVDDDEITRSLLKETLCTKGYEVVSASNGCEAWEILSKDQIKLVITDWYMPEVNGIDLCKKIRSSGLPRYIYIILLTSHGQRQDIITGLASGADEFISKPFDPEELIIRVQNGERILTLETRDLTIFAMAKLAESRDPETGFHLDRMQKYCEILTRALGKTNKYKEVITEEYIHNIYNTSPMHDIGKVSIPDSVLLKPGRLSDEEWVIMKTHPTAGAVTFRYTMEKFPEVPFLKMAHDIALYHHERYNGTGYPYGIKGDRIPLTAQITALADVYDALTSRRVYKKAFTPYVARSIILEGVGKHFNPDIGKAFVAAESSFIEVLNSFKDEVQ